MTELLTAFTVLIAVGCGATGGGFYIFSSFVMKALGRLSSSEGVQAMQAINMAAVRSSFFISAVATLFGCLLLAAIAAAELHEPWARYLLLGSGLYAVGGIGVTLLSHLTRNDELARLDPTGREAAEQWPRYLVGWTFWNHVRTGGALLGSAALIVAAVVG